jgi:hypothetical protein
VGCFEEAHGGGAALKWWNCRAMLNLNWTEHGLCFMAVMVSVLKL